MLTTKFTLLRSLLLRQQDGVKVQFEEFT